VDALAGMKPARARAKADVTRVEVSGFRSAQGGAAEAESEHPLARAIVAAARELGSIPAATDFRAMSGRGVEACRSGSGCR
jgi:cation transport ATPase